jgi:hypothetical protein
MARWLTLIWGAGLVSLAIYPIFRDPRADGFPFSTYPMFAQPRERPTLYFVEGLTSNRDTVALPPELVANGPVMQALGTLGRAQSQGRASLRQLCERIAAKVAARPDFAQVRRVQLVSASFEPIAYFMVGPRQEERAVLQRCRVRGRA